MAGVIDRKRLRVAGMALGVAVLGLGARSGQAEPARPSDAGGTSCNALLTDPARYRVIALPLLPAAINDDGQVAGTTGTHRAALWTSRSGLIIVPLPGSFAYSDAVAINASGQVLVMAYDRARDHRQAYVFHHGKLRSLPGGQPRAFHINDAGLIAGEAIVAGSARTEPVVWTPTGLRPLDACCGGTAQDINRSGDAVGDIYDEHGRYGAFLWTPGAGLERIGPPDGYSSALALNDLGHVLIDTFSAVQLYHSGQLVTLELAHKLPSHPHALNNCDVIVGEFGPFSDKDLAFRWTRAGGFRDLNTLLPEDSAWKLQSASAINDRGVIVGRGDFHDEDGRGYMLVPAPSPGALSR